MAEEKHITELKRLLGSHMPMIVFPFGFKEPESFRLVGEGFVFGESDKRKDGFYWLDAGWQESMSGIQAEHAIYGKISKPIKGGKLGTDDYHGYEQYWNVGGAVLMQVQNSYITIPDGQEVIVSYDAAVDNMRLATVKVNDKYGSRKVAKEFMLEYGKLE